MYCGSNVNNYRRNYFFFYIVRARASNSEQLTIYRSFADRVCVSSRRRVDSRNTSNDGRFLRRLSPENDFNLRLRTRFGVNVA